MTPYWLDGLGPINCYRGPVDGWRTRDDGLLELRLGSPIDVVQEWNSPVQPSPTSPATAAELSDELPSDLQDRWPDQNSTPASDYYVLPDDMQCLPDDWPFGPAGDDR